MYSEWASVQKEIESSDSHTSVLSSFPSVVGRDVAASVVRQVADSLVHNAAPSDLSQLNQPSKVNWTMEVLCYGLTLPFSEHETIRHCVSIYCEWFTALTTPKPCVPKPVQDDPNLYAQKMLHHLFNLFVPRDPDPPQAAPNAKAIGSDYVMRQAQLCHRVLRQICTVAEESTMLTRDTWESLLKFLLAINDTLLAPPTCPDGIGENLCERVLSVLFQLWLLACQRCFPSPPLWKTFRDMCANWRHHAALISQWHRVNVALTSHLLKSMYGPEYPELVISSEEQAMIPTGGLDSECVAQCWFRMLHILSNPVDLFRPEVISNTPKFLHMALTSEAVVEPHQHPCLASLPAIFLKSMKAISTLVDAFLGLSPSEVDQLSLLSLGSRQTISGAATGLTPPQQRRNKTFALPSQHSTKGGKSSLLTPSKPQSGSATSTPSNSPVSISLHARPPLAMARPKVNSILHLFGSWLIEAAIAGCKVHGSENVDPDKEHEMNQSRHSYDAGRAEACGALCRIMCSHKTGEEILPVYLSRFYIAMYYGLQTNEDASGQVLANILFNACDMLRIDLDGVNILLPQIITALQLILTDLKPNLRWPEHMSLIELRKASIHLLLSILALPLHYRNLQISGMFGECEGTAVTFMSLKKRLLDLLVSALTIETDSTNTQMLLGGLMMCVQDLALSEEADKIEAEKNAAESVDNTPLPQPDTNKDSAHGLFGHAASLVCNRLMATWKMELNIALAAIEVLSSLAKVKLSALNLLMGKRTVNWVCEFIVYQCSRPAPAHSKDLHSMIVSAFHCLSLWLVEHEHLMADKDCLHCVLEVVELGISGAISQNRVSDKPKLKGDKEFNPVSMRVKDAAESLLTTIMEHVGSFPPPCGPESICSLLDESSLLKYCKEGGLPEQGSPFRYFILDGSTIVGLLEQPLGNDEDPLPTVTALIRGPFGRHAWTMQLRHGPRNKKATSKTTLSEPARPEPDENVGTHHNIKHRYFPEIVDTIPKVQADRSIPSLESTLSQHSSELERLESFIEQQVAFENERQALVEKERKESQYPNPKTECKPPNICHDFQTARLFLSHYSLLSLDALAQPEPSQSSMPPSLVMLDTTQHQLLADLEQLDSIPARLTDTMHVFYVKSGQKMPWEILSNVTKKSNVDVVFLEFLRSMGWPVDVQQHAGWTGSTGTAWKILAQDDDVVAGRGASGGGCYDGRRQVLYWADVASELAIVVPSPDTYQPANPERRNSTDSNPDKLSGVAPPVPSSAQNVVKAVEPASAMKPKSLSLDLAEPPQPPARQSSHQPPRQTESPAATPTADVGRAVRRSGRFSAAAALSDTKVFVVWLESFEDADNFPAGDLLHSCQTGLEPSTANTSSSSLAGRASSIDPNLSGRSHTSDSPIFLIFIHALQNGMFRIHLQGQLGRVSLAIPLVSGMVVSRRALGVLVRQTAVNICRRRRLENDAFQPPHCRRKLKIKEILDRYRNKLSASDFYTALFQDVNKGH